MTILKIPELSTNWIYTVIRMLLIPALMWFGLWLYVLLFTILQDFGLINWAFTALAETSFSNLQTKQILLAIHLLSAFIVYCLWAALFIIILPYIYRNKALFVAVAIWIIPGGIELKHLVLMALHTGITPGIWGVLYKFITSFVLIVYGTHLYYKYLAGIGRIAIERPAQTT